MAETGTASGKFIDQILDENGQEIAVSGAAVRDKESGKSFADHLLDTKAHRTDAEIEALIEETIEPIKTTLNNFLTGDPDDNGTLDRLRELVQVIDANRENIDKLLELNSSGTGIAFVDSAESEPEYNGKLRFVVSSYTPAE